MLLPQEGASGEFVEQAKNTHFGLEVRCQFLDKKCAPLSEFVDRRSTQLHLLSLTTSGYGFPMGWDINLL